MIVNVTYRHFLLRDEIDAAREEVARGLSGWYQGRGTTVQDFYERIAQVRIALYAGEASRAWALIDEAFKPIMRSPIGRVQNIRIEMLQLRAQAALLRASQETNPRRVQELLREANDNATKIEREDARWSRPLSHLLHAAAAMCRRDAKDSRDKLLAAEQTSREHDMEGFAQAAAWRRGQILGGDAGATLQRGAEAWMSEQGIRSPRRFATLLAPGFDLP
jgi:hypothetical protein